MGIGVQVRFQRLVKEKMCVNCLTCAKLVNLDILNEI